MENQLMKGLVSFVLIYASISYGQNKGDLGINLSTNQVSRFALEYRTLQNGQYNWRIGFAYGDLYGPSWRYAPNDIISSSDSLIVYDYRSYVNSVQTLRFGLERQFSTSIFSTFADLTLGYQSRTNLNYKIPYVLTNYGWRMGSFSESDTVGDVYLQPGQDFSYHHPIVAGYSQFQSYRQHFLVAGLRLGLNMDLPIKKAFILHTGIVYAINTPIYMGTTNVHDTRGDIVISTPPSIINMSVNAEIGLRYNIGSFKNRERKKSR